MLRASSSISGISCRPGASTSAKNWPLARLARPEHRVDFQAPVVLASAPAPASQSPVGEPETDDGGASAPLAPDTLLHQASLKTETREVPARQVVALPQTTARSTDKPATADKSATIKSVEKPGLAAAHRSTKKDAAASVSAPPKKSVDKPTAPGTKPVTKPVRIAKVDPLAPLPGRRSGTPKDSTADR